MKCRGYVLLSGDLGVLLSFCFYFRHQLFDCVLTEHAQRSGSRPTIVADYELVTGRKLLLCVRESPYNLVHLENMVRAARAGAVIVPVTVLLYQRPAGVDDIIRLFVCRVLDLLGLDPADMPRWKGLPGNS